jgi:hypothetical protein
MPLKTLEVPDSLKCRCSTRRAASNGEADIGGAVKGRNKELKSMSVDIGVDMEGRRAIQTR